MTYAIGFDVAPPKKAEKLPLDKMVPNSSILIPWEVWKRSAQERQLTRISGRVYYYAKMNDKTFSISKEMSGLRVWRIK